MATLPLQTEFAVEQKLREKLIDLWLLTPSIKFYGIGERPPMSNDLVRKYKEKLIREGVLIPKAVKRSLTAH